MVFINDGAEMLVMSFILPVIKKEWGLNSFEQGLLGSFVFFGIFLASFVAGPIGDIYGRKKLLIYSNFFLCIFGFWSAFCSNIYSLSFIRGVYGFFAGLNLPTIKAILSECLPIAYRGKGVLFVEYFFALGEIITCILVYFTLTDLSSGKWRLLLIWTAIPGILTFFFCYFFLEESLRFSILNEKIKFDDILVKIKWLTSKNNRNAYDLTDNEKEKFKKWVDLQMKSQDKTKGLEFLELVKPKYLWISIKIWVAFFTAGFVFFGFMFILPSIVTEIHEKSNTKHKSTDITDVIIPISTEFIGITTALIMIEKQSFGRKNTIAFFFFVSGVSSFLIFMLENRFFVLICCIMRCSMAICLDTIWVLTTEVYPTSFRNTGAALSSAFLRMGSTIMPWFTIVFLGLNPFSPFIFFGCLSIFASISTFMIPYDTRGRELDVLTDEIELKEVFISNEEK